MTTHDISDLVTDNHAHEKLFDPLTWTYPSRHAQTVDYFAAALTLGTNASRSIALEDLWGIIDTNPLAFAYCDSPWNCFEVRGGELRDTLKVERFAVRAAQIRLLLHLLGRHLGEYSGDPHVEAEGWFCARMHVVGRLLVDRDDPDGHAWAMWGFSSWLESASEVQLDEARLALIEALRDPVAALRDYHEARVGERAR